MVKSRNNRKTRNNRKSRNNHKSRNNRKTRRQRGGALAPFSTGDAYLLNAAARVQAQTGGLDSAFAELPSVIPRQGGGRRSHRHRQRGGMQDWSQAYEKPLMAGMSQTAGSRSRRRSRLQYRKRSQRGGMADFNASPMLLDKGQYGAAGQNVQFQNEAGVNPSYREFAGPQ